MIGNAAHSPLMETIQAEWNQAVSAAGFADTRTPVVANVAAAPLWKSADLRADVMAQMQSRVRWTESVQWMAAQGVNTFIELGSGTVLGGMLKRLVEGARSLPLGNPADFAALQ